MQKEVFMPAENNTTEYAYREVLASSLGALGVAVQNYQAVELFLKSVIPASQHSIYAIRAAAIGAGGVCSGMVNFKMNMDLLDDFFARRTFKDYDAYVKEAKAYDFALMSSLEDDYTNARDDVVYLSENSKTYFVKGMQKEACFTEEVDLTNLAEKLADIKFKKSILVITSEAGHTQKKYFDWKKASLEKQR